MTKKIFTEIDTPALLIEKSVMENNISRMQKIANDNNVNLRPHTKTHKSPDLARKQLQCFTFE